MKRLTRHLIEQLDQALQQGRLTLDQARDLCDLVDESKSEDELNKIFIVKGIVAGGGKERKK